MMAHTCSTVLGAKIRAGLATKEPPQLLSSFLSRFDTRQGSTRPAKVSLLRLDVGTVGLRPRSAAESLAA